MKSFEFKLAYYHIYDTLYVYTGISFYDKEITCIQLKKPSDKSFI